ncbi:reverse transcriptase domain-containing protein [Tanacetum coccineum]|uniref:Reverse transcriptase domain-containing protein n=1 Tax=Tanacetum coccineum TaxID=301880 RepID=A0ABQ4YFP7_9ASTR
MGIVVSTVHGAIKFHTPNSVGTIVSEHNSQRSIEEEENSANSGQGNAKDILSCIDTEEKIEIKDEYPEQKVTIGRQLPTRVKMRLTEHQLNVFNHTEPVKQKKRSLAPERNKVVRTQVEELVEAGVLQEVKYQTWIGRNMEVNADDMVIKSDSGEEMLADIKETLGRLRAINLKLNPRKCSFGVEEGIYSGHLITKQGIRADPSKVKAISALQPPKTVSEIQSFSKKLAALNKFLSKSVEKALPFMKTLKSCTSEKMVQWTTEANEAFQRIKECLDSLPTMVVPTKGETLTVYLAASEKNVSAILMAERGKKQAPVYFVSWTLHGAEQKYPELEKLILSLVTPQGSSKDISKHTQYKNITCGKRKREERKRKELEPEKTWKLFTDGASSSDGSGAGLMLVNPEGKEYTYALRFEFKTTNNELVANHVKGLFEARQQTIKQYLEKTMGLLSSFPNYLIKHIKREQNKKADALSKLASMTFSKLAKEVLVEVIHTKLVADKEVTDIVKEDEASWMVPIREYLKEGILPKDPQKARKLRIKVPLYKMIEERLYRRSYMSPWLRCVGLMQAKSIIKEVYEGSYGLHSGPRSVVSKITRLEYYWPSMHKDAKELIHKCEACQIYSLVPRKPKQEMTSITSAWPFSQWGIDIVGRHMEKFVWEHIVCRFGRPQIIISDNRKQFAEGTFHVFCKKLGTLQAFTSVYHPQANG